MGKDREKHLVGQPIFEQIVKMIPREKFNLLVRQSGSDNCYRVFKSWEQLVSMLFGILSRCDSSGELCDGMRAMGGKLNYLGMDCSPAKSTFGDGLRNRDNEFFKSVYAMLIKHFELVLSVSRKEKISFEKFYAFDSTTITLFSDIMKGVGRNPKGEGKKKGGLKVHMLTDVHADTAVFAHISEAKMHDKKFLSHLHPTRGSMLVFDKAYNYYQQFAEWTEEGVNFVCRLKENAKYEVQGDAILEKTLGKEEFGVYKVEHIHLKYKKKKEKKESILCLRLVYYRDEQGRNYKFITNNWEITEEEVALIYKYRWTIELTFKKLKQNFQLHFFYSDTENGIKTQIWCTLIAHLLLNVVSKISGSKKAFSTIAALIRIHLISHLDLLWVVTEGRRAYIKRKNNKTNKNKSPTAIQMELF
ncbi:MAG: IS4 family transposase [Prevotellaceae bacterium]|jgi:hypothetical protein|nr:IS4 family transposase [Prevotellaceae bacterium]